MKAKIKTSFDIILAKMQKYCAYQERCHQEVRYKLLNIKVYGDQLEDIINKLIEDDFLNEERFARAYARGKILFKKWGKNKVLAEFRARSISTYCTRKALEEIDEQVYRTMISSELHKKFDQGASSRQKLFAFGLRRGYEMELMNPILDELYK